MEIKELHRLFLNCKGIETDTRKIQTNQIFFALQGENFNGNKFAQQALNKGAVYAVVDGQVDFNDARLILVSDVLKTLQELATYHRKYLGIPILSITGSNGKTTTKELLHAVLRKKFNCKATIGNLNNHIGVPLTLLSMNTQTEFGIVEMGANHPKEIELLSNIAQPDFGYITNFGKAHLEGFGSLEGVIKAKSELYDYLKDHSKLLFLNADDPVQCNQLNYQNKYSFGDGENCDVKIEYLPNSGYAEIKADGVLYNSQITGSYNAVNMAAAVAMSTYFKLPSEGIRKAINSYVPANNRSQIVNHGSVKIILDAYNANPTSMRAALENFATSPGQNKMVILGDMFELGKDSPAEHEDIVQLIKELNFKSAVLVGENFYGTKSYFNNIQKFPNFEELKNYLVQENIQNASLLIKGSRGMALERVLEVLGYKQKSG